MNAFNVAPRTLIGRDKNQHAPKDPIRAAAVVRPVFFNVVCVVAALHRNSEKGPLALSVPPPARDGKCGATDWKMRSGRD